VPSLHKRHGKPLVPESNDAAMAWCMIKMHSEPPFRRFLTRFSSLEVREQPPRYCTWSRDEHVEVITFWTKRSWLEILTSERSTGLRKVVRHWTQKSGNDMGIEARWV
jgi:hypothetical protein